MGRLTTLLLNSTAIFRGLSEAVELKNAASIPPRYLSRILPYMNFFQSLCD
jgi:hypothetical protein